MHEDQSKEEEGRMTTQGAGERKECLKCRGLLWVCENHPDKPWDIDNEVGGGCDCGAGMPCECNPMAMPIPGSVTIEDFIKRN